jgi:hypothetical protein
MTFRPIFLGAHYGSYSRRKLDPGEVRQAVVSLLAAVWSPSDWKRMYMKNALFVCLFIAALYVTSSDRVNAADPTPRALLFAGFNDGKVSSDRELRVDAAHFDIRGKIGEGAVLTKSYDTGTFLGSNIVRFDTRRSTVAFWMKLNDLHLEGLPQIFGVYPGPPRLDATFSLVDGFTFAVNFGNHAETINTGKFQWNVGDWHHVIWTWQGSRHRVYIDGALKREKIFSSPMQWVAESPLWFGPTFSGYQNATIDEFAIYNFAFSEAEVAAAYYRNVSAPLSPITPHGIDVVAEWGPGVQKVSVAADSGNDLEASAVRYIVDVQRDNTLIASGEITKLNRGFGEAVIATGPMTAGTYVVTVKLFNGSNHLLGTKVSSAFILERTPWLGNSLGITNDIQPPWTPIVANGLKLSVWGREYDLSGGFGLPVQIMSQGQPLLTRPIALEIDKGNGRFQLKPSSLLITETSAHKVTWQGSATGEGLTATVIGSLEYDGMVLITLKLFPDTVPVTIRKAHLQTVIPSERAVFMHTTTDQPYWWYTYKSKVPIDPGVFHTNLVQPAFQSSFLPVVLFSDDDRGLEWFAENPRGWRVNESLPMQEMIRDTAGNVQLQNNIVNKTVSLNEPMEISFGFEATPVKPLPADWRGGRFGSAGNASIFPNNNLDVYWDWRGHESGGRSNTNFPIFRLIPVDADAYKTAVQPIRNDNRKVAPFINFHVTLPVTGDNWTSLDILKSETRNDGWIAMPSKGDADYWLYHVNTALSNNTYDALYIDEPDPNTSASLLSGGYIKEDGTHGAGYMLLGMRDKLKRLRQAMLDNGKRPLIWLHTTAKMYPHAFAFADIASDGESFMFENPTDPDWIDQWGNGRFGSEWIRGLSRSQKFGLIPAFLNYIKFWYLPTDYTKALRSMYGVLAIHDIGVTTGDNSDNWFVTIKKDFGITEPDVAFKGFWEQSGVRPDDANIKVSYYNRTKSALIFLTNMGEAYSGNVSIDFSALGLNPAGAVITDAESKQTINIVGGKINLWIPRHDFRALQIVASSPSLAQVPAGPSNLLFTVVP